MRAVWPRCPKKVSQRSCIFSVPMARPGLLHGDYHTKPLPPENGSTVQERESALKFGFRGSVWRKRSGKVTQLPRRRLICPPQFEYVMLPWCLGTIPGDQYENGTRSHQSSAPGSCSPKPFWSIHDDHGRRIQALAHSEKKGAKSDPALFRLGRIPWETRFLPAL